MWLWPMASSQKLLLLRLGWTWSIATCRVGAAFGEVAIAAQRVGFGFLSAWPVATALLALNRFLQGSPARPIHCIPQAAGP